MIEWNEKEININEEGYTILYLYTPLCGTCQVAKKMLSVVDEMMSDLSIYSVNLNFYPHEALQWVVESVPCLLVFKGDEAAVDLQFVKGKISQMHQ